MRFSFLVIIVLHLSLTGLSQSADRTLIQIPYHSQFGEGNPVSPNNWSTVACLNMVFDYHEEVPGPPFCQPEIAMVTNTDDVGGSFSWAGTQGDDVRRGCHFSLLSQSLNGGFWGYSWRAIGYGAVDTIWDWSISELKSILDLGYPLIIHSAPGPLDSLYRKDGSPFHEPSDTTAVGHSRVLVGYDDTLSPPVFIMHDPWSPGPDSAGEFIWCTQTYFVTEVWPQHSAFLFTAPWEMSAEHPDTFDMNSLVTVRISVRYSSPSLLGGLFPVANPCARLTLPSAVSFDVGDSSLHFIQGISATGDVDSTEWYLRTGEETVSDSISVVAYGLVSSASTSYPSGYTDSIGGTFAFGICVADISPPSIDLLYPNGGETVNGGGEDTIIWTAEDNVGVISIAILLTTDAGSSWDTLATEEENDSSFACIFPLVDSDSCKVQVLAFDGGANVDSDTSDSFFTIQSTGILEGLASGCTRPLFLGAEPNPFRTKTTISYSLGAGEEKTILSIHDTAGRLVKRRELRASSGAQGCVVWDGRDRRGGILPSGVYFLKIATSTHTESRSVIIIR